MRNLAYNNINSRFTYNIIWTLLSKFWINEVIKQKYYSKLWLTLIVYNSNNKSFTLINNLPFNIDSYTDILIVLKQVFKTSFFNDRDIISTVVFKYHFVSKNNYKRHLYITNLYLYISILIIVLILLICIYVLYIDIFSIYNSDLISKETLNFSYNGSLKEFNKEYNNSSNKNYFFSPIVDLFNGNYNVPSKFIDKNLEELDLFKPLLKPLSNYQETPRSFTLMMLELNNLNNRMLEYESVVSDLIAEIENSVKK